MSDEILIKRILESRDTDAYSEIVSRYKNAVFNICVSVVGDYYAAEDISQETFIDGYMKLASLKEHDKLFPWLCRIARNKCCNYLKRSSHLYDCEIEECKLALDDTPEIAALQNDDKRLVKQAVSNLTEPFRTAVILYYYEKRTIKQTAEILRVSERVIKYRLSEARKKLKKELYYMNTEKGHILSQDFEAKVKANIEKLKTYYWDHNFSNDGKKSLYDETINLLENTPESKGKHSLLAAVYNNAPKEAQVDKKEIMKHAELGENSEIIGELLLDEYIYKATPHKKACKKPLQYDIIKA